MSLSASSPQGRGQQTRQSVLKAATAAFAKQGYDAVSLRDVAVAAGINQALIAYHFGNKEGLYLAVFEQITERMQERVGPRVEALASLLNQATGPGKSERALMAPIPDIRLQWFEAICSITDAMLMLVASDESTEWAQLITREQHSPTAAFEVLYERFLGRMLGLLTRLVTHLRPDEDSASVRLMVATVIGQVLVFRVSRTGVLRHMKWEAIGPAELVAIQQQVRRNLQAMLLE